MQPEYYAVDRIEGEFALCEDPEGEMRELPLSLLPPDVREGVLLLKEPDGYVIDWEETELRRQQHYDRLSALWEKE